MKKDYSVQIVEGSKEFTGKQAVMIKDTQNSIGLNDLTKDGEFVFKPIDYAVLEIHNEKSENKDYMVYVFITADGEMYSTSSINLFETMTDIITDMTGCNEDWAIRVFQKPSKNRSGQTFLTCSVC